MTFIANVHTLKFVQVDFLILKVGNLQEKQK